MLNILCLADFDTPNFGLSSNVSFVATAKTVVFNKKKKNYAPQ
jgi:hypothetical protein